MSEQTSTMDVSAEQQHEFNNPTKPSAATSSASAKAAKKSSPTKKRRRTTHFSTQKKKKAPDSKKSAASVKRKAAAEKVEEKTGITDYPQSAKKQRKSLSRVNEAEKPVDTAATKELPSRPESPSKEVDQTVNNLNTGDGMLMTDNIPANKGEKDHQIQRDSFVEKEAGTKETEKQAEKPAEMPKEAETTRQTSTTERKQEGTGEQRFPAKKKLKYGSALSIGEKSEGGLELLEKGQIAFIYRPKVQLTEVNDFNDVQRLYIELIPESSTAAKDRLLIVGNKKLPSLHSHQPYYAIVDVVSESKGSIAEKLAPTDYETKTRGSRHVEGGRICGMGVYEIVKKDEQTHLAYVLEWPQQLGEAQTTFNIREEEEFVISVRNPHKLSNKQSDSTGLADEGRGASIPEELTKKFAQGKTTELRWFPAVPEVLNYEKVEMLMIGAHEKIGEKLAEISKEMHEEAQKEEEKLERKDDAAKEVYMEMGLQDNLNSAAKSKGENDGGKSAENNAAATAVSSQEQMEKPLNVGQLA
jgi:hypothetical protein